MVEIKKNTRITKKIISEILKMVKAENGNRKVRICGEYEVKKLIKIIRDHRNCAASKKINIYSSDGFVANSYKYRSYITRISAYNDLENGSWFITADTPGASRSHGSGSLVTINGRGA